MADVALVSATAVAEFSLVGILELDHVAAGHGHPFRGYRRSAAAHVPGRIGFAERTLRRHAIHWIDHVVAALGRGGAGAEANALGGGGAEDHRLDAMVFQTMIEVAVQELVGSALLLVDHF